MLEGIYRFGDQRVGVRGAVQNEDDDEAELAEDEEEKSDDGNWKLPTVGRKGFGVTKNFGDRELVSLDRFGDLKMPLTVESRRFILRAG